MNGQRLNEKEAEWNLIHVGYSYMVSIIIHNGGILYFMYT